MRPECARRRGGRDGAVITFRTEDADLLERTMARLLDGRLVSSVIHVVHPDPASRENGSRVPEIRISCDDALERERVHRLLDADEVLPPPRRPGCGAATDGPPHGEGFVPAP